MTRTDSDICKYVNCNEHVAISMEFDCTVTIQVDTDADLADIAILYTAFVFPNFQPFPKPKKNGLAY